MLCPSCGSESSRVVDSRSIELGMAIRRRRECAACEHRFTTIERSVLLVTKRNGVVEDFSRDKVIKGVRRACQGREVSDDALKRLAHEVEQAIRADHGSQVQAHDIGLAILGPLRDLDEVAYLRFASVYKSFDSAEDFEQEIGSLRTHRQQRGGHADQD
ncbi:transcriptional repressor NrdR [Corynebacterium sp. 320]|uniref:Transcriptional repressor NrdR n=1 Tax=Corynebacterium zhongnanshanii TaxID=2768834 RepID=A0ABQ6VG53_9CORY|nr:MULTISPECIES: transcriptional regulator NrdR [Corynebacterium]KAB1503755.1 transcriptional repressor NrdR [Corynebacterium sp. 320]KAB1553145.1 transcriptional repressor NrdR [Corynebacterium sp. 321]KAB1553637.1 transcriptional repressor NrdR [Corynebacterium sp. 319]KAB3523394.1 transcriptional repressor NrdR [Corynebacterium zhongnanshanii]KAB3527891.1 transcriptional repressor NrdR [Corynebacterium sp. 250]